MNEQFLEIYKYLNSYDAKSAGNIYYGLELFLNSFDDSLVSLNNKISVLAEAGEYSSIGEVSKICEKIKKIQNEINGLINNMTLSDMENNNSEKDNTEITVNTVSVISENSPEVTIRTSKTDYNKYLVDTNEVHYLNENFENKRPCAYMFKEKRYLANTWREMLISVCVRLSKENYSLFQSFINNPNFKSAKRSYFSLNHIYGENDKIPETNIYIRRNINSNTITNIIKKMLIEFNINPSTFYIYLRADYSDLHNNSNDNIQIKPSDNNETEQIESGIQQMKIGEYVKMKMQKLSDAKYNFQPEMLSALLDRSKTKKMFGLYYPFLQKIDLNKNLDSQYSSRYWKDIFYFNKHCFFICSQWFNYNRKNFEQWIKEIEKSL